jgi:hypothetical protein
MHLVTRCVSKLPTYHAADATASSLSNFTSCPCVLASAAHPVNVCPAVALEQLFISGLQNTHAERQKGTCERAVTCSVTALRARRRQLHQHTPSKSQLGWTRHAAGLGIQAEQH